MPSKEYLHECFVYEDGKLFWKERPVHHFKDSEKISKTGKFKTKEASAKRWNSCFAGKEAFRSSNLGYRYGTINAVYYKTHRIVWKMHHGYDPIYIDHINGDKTDNRIENLRDVTPQGNLRNMQVSTRNKSGRLGVRVFENYWTAQIKVNHKQIHLGTFHSFEEAVNARENAEKFYGFYKGANKFL